MINTLNIGAYIFDKLSTSIPTIKTYPIVADNDAKYPFIVYKRIGLSSLMCKDGNYEDVATVEVTVVAEKYATSVDIAQQVREALENNYDTFDGMEIETTLQSGTEDFSDSAYTQKLTYKIKTNN